MEKTIGILGGMGPEATSDFFAKIVKNTKAGRDQDHPRVILYNNPKIPDRTDFLLHGGENPLPELLRSARLLEEWGAGVIAMPCNTAHYFFDDVQAEVSVPVLNMIELTAEKIAASPGRLEKVGLLATEGTVQSGVYRKVFISKGVELLLPDPGEQQVVTRSIYRVKSGQISEGDAEILAVCSSLFERGGDAVILGCTELPVLFSRLKYPGNLVDPTEILAAKAVETALKGVL